MQQLAAAAAGPVATAAALQQPGLRLKAFPAALQYICAALAAAVQAAPVSAANSHSEGRVSP